MEPQQGRGKVWSGRAVLWLALAPFLGACGEPSAPAPDATAWVVPWNQHHAPAVLAELLADGYRVQAAQRELRLDTADGPRAFDRGALLIHAGIQPERLPPVHQRLGELLERHAVRAHSVFSGRAREGLDLGSPSAPVLEAPRPVLVTGDGVSAYGAGYTWHWFDVLLDRPVTRIDTDELPSSLAEYTHVILPPGRYGSLGDDFSARLTEFVLGGGPLVALGDSAEWVESLDLGWSFADGRKEEEGAAEAEPEFARYADYDKDAARRIIGGSALAVELDTSHPLAYGYTADRLTTFRQGAHVLRATDNPYASPGRYADEPLVAGYLSDEVTGRVKGTVAVAADRFGRGLVVRIADHPLFRGYWAGAERLFANALFFGQLVESTRLPD